MGEIAFALLGIGGGGINMLESWQNKLPKNSLCVAVDRNEKPFLNRPTEHKLALMKIKALGSTVEYAESAQAEVARSIDHKMPELLDLLQGRERVILMAGLGGVIGTWATQIICNRLVAMDKQVVTVLIMPFGFERERIKVAECALPGFDGSADRVLCYNDYLIKHTPEHTSFEEALEIMNEQAFQLLSMSE